MSSGHEVDLAILSASATLCAVLLALLTTFIVLGETGRLAGLGRRGLQAYRTGSLIVIGLTCLSLLTALLALVSSKEIIDASVATEWLFVATLGGTFIGAIALFLLTR